MNESEFHRLADVTLNALFDALQESDEKYQLDVELEGGVMTIQPPTGGKPFVLSKHAPTRQLWLSSPVSGGLHFAFDEASAKWVLPDGRALASVLGPELRSHGGIGVELE